MIIGSKISPQSVGLVRPYIKATLNSNNVATAIVYKGFILTTPSWGNIVSNVDWDDATILSIPPKCFYRYSTSGNCLTNSTLPQGLVSIGEKAFYNQAGVTFSSCPSSLTTLGDYAFYYCQSIPSMDLSTTTVSAIPSQCFYYCKAMTYVDLPSTVTSIAAQAFRNCTALKTVYCRAITPPTLANTSAFGSVDLLHIYVPVGSANAYKAATNWSSFASLIEEYNFT